MPIQKICPLMAALKSNPNFIVLKQQKTVKEVMLNKPMGIAAKNEAWWRSGYREAKQIEAEVLAGTYKPEEQPSLYKDNGGINYNFFRSPDDDGLI